jgi:3-hydroxyacyl-CoA dehydrogenase
LPYHPPANLPSKSTTTRTILPTLTPSFRSGEAVSSADLIIEAIIESIKIKRDLFGFLDSKANQRCIFASNTSSLSIRDIAEACSAERQAR